MCVRCFGSVHQRILKSSLLAPKTLCSICLKGRWIEKCYVRRGHFPPFPHFLVPSTFRTTCWQANSTANRWPCKCSPNPLLSRSFFPSPLCTVTPSLHLPVTHSRRQFRSERIGSGKHSLTSHKAFKEQTSRSNPTFPDMWLLSESFSSHPRQQSPSLIMRSLQTRTPPLCHASFRSPKTGFQLFNRTGSQ